MAKKEATENNRGRGGVHHGKQHGAQEKGGTKDQRKIKLRMADLCLEESSVARAERGQW